MAYLKAVLPNTRRSVKSTSTHELDRDRGILLCLYRNIGQGISNTPETFKYKFKNHPKTQSAKSLGVCNLKKSQSGKRDATPR